MIVQTFNQEAMKQILEDVLVMLIYLGDAAGKEHRMAIEEHIRKMAERAEAQMKSGGDDEN